MSSVTLPAPVQEKIPVSKAIRYGWLVVNIPVLALICGIPALVFLVAESQRLSVWLECAGLPVGIAVAWLWWSYATPKWRLWAMRRADNLYTLQTQAVQAQLVWPHGSIYENTEFKSPLDVLKERHVEITDYLDKFRYYLDYLESDGKSFPGLPALRQDVDAFREVVYQSKGPAVEPTAGKIAMDQLRIALKFSRTASVGEDWPALIDMLLQMLDQYEGLARRQGTA